MRANRERMSDESRPMHATPNNDDHDYIESWADDRDAAARARTQRRASRATKRGGKALRTTPMVQPASAQLSRLRTRLDTGLLASRWGRGLASAVAVLALSTVVGLIALWPHGAGHHGPAQAMGGATLAASVTAVRDVRCPGPVRQICRRIVVRIGAGSDRGSTQSITLGPANVAPSVQTGEAVRVQRAVGAPADAERYGFVSVDRRSTMLWLAAAFALLVVVLARRRGVLALVGFAGSLLLIVRFVVPAISEGRPAFAVAIVGSLAVMFITVGLTYGLRAPSLAAILGIASSLLLAGLLGTIAVHAAALDGRANEFSIALAQVNGGISLQGVVLAGLMFGALGVLADMAVTQASAVMALRHANPTMSIGALYRGAFGVGRDHLVATTHTLVLVYVGATLPLLLVVYVSGTNATDGLNVPDLAEPIIATLVGAIALLVSVPLTTGLAALLAAPIPAAALPDSGHPH